MTFAAKVLKAFHDVYDEIQARDLKAEFANLVLEEFGLEITLGLLFPGVGFEQAMIGLLHLIGTATQNLMIDVAKIFEANGAMPPFWEFISASFTDIGLKAQQSSKTRTVRNWLARGATGQWMAWAIFECVNFLLYKSPTKMGRCELPLFTSSLSGPHDANAPFSNAWLPSHSTHLSPPF